MRPAQVILYEQWGRDGSQRQHPSDEEGRHKLKTNRRSFREHSLILHGRGIGCSPADASQEAAERSVIIHCRKRVVKVEIAQVASQACVDLGLSMRALYGVEA